MTRPTIIAVRIGAVLGAVARLLWAMRRTGWWQ